MELKGLCYTFNEPVVDNYISLVKDGWRSYTYKRTDYKYLNSFDFNSLRYLPNDSEWGPITLVVPMEFM